MKANPTVLGAFIVGAVGLIVAAIVVFGSGSLFTATDSFALYFRGSVNGLNVGAPVKFRGVKIGAVTEVRALYDPGDYSAYIQVEIKIDPNRFSEITDGAVTLSSPQDPDDFETLIKRGLRGQLQLESFVTGLLFVDLDFYPGTPAALVGIRGEKQELPTIPTALEQVAETARQVMEKIGQLPLEQLVSDISAILQRISSIVTAQEVDQILQAVTSILQRTDQSVARLPELLDQVGGAATSANSVMNTAKAALIDARQLIGQVEGQAEPLLGNVQNTLTATRRALVQTQKTLKALEDGVPSVLGEAQKAFAATAELAGPESEVVTDLSRSLEAVEEAARSIRLLADYLQRNPGALLRGKGRAGGR